MYARPAAALTGTAQALEASDLIRSCVHCGFCLPACPTYRVTGNELDSPRGRIYLIKELIEQGGASETTRTHLDRCLTCRACESACPSAVQYGRLVDLGRELVEREPPAPRPGKERWLRSLLLAVATRRALFTPLVRLGRLARPLLPTRLASLVPPQAREAASLDWPVPRHGRRLAVLEGCVQPALAPEINAAAARVLDRLGVSLVRAAGIGCCGAMHHHLGRTDVARERVRHNVAAATRLLEEGVEAIVSTASGCGVYVRDYGHVLRDEAASLRVAAARVGTATRDLCEVIDPAAVAALAGSKGPTVRVAWQAPCSLQHGQRASTAGRVEAILRAAGCELVPVHESTLCCGSAGTYSLLQPTLSRELRQRKLDALTGARPDVIASANIGCLEHLRQASAVPVRHWIELVDAALSARCGDRYRRATTT